MAEQTVNEVLQHTVCYHCGLSIFRWQTPTGKWSEWAHASWDDYQQWVEAAPPGSRRAGRDHKARFEPICRRCGRDNANATHTALEAFGHLGHKFEPADA